MKNTITITIDGKKIEIQIPNHLLRDWFAGQALAGSQWAKWESRNGLSEEIANKCYAKADALMEERLNR